MAAHLAGCSGEELEEVALNPVTGSIRVDGKPASGVTVGFQPVNKEGAKGGYATTDANGQFSVVYHDGRPGLPEGQYVVLLTWLTLPDGSPLPKDAMAADAGAENRLPDLYNSMDNNPNQVVVQAGENPPVDIDVPSKRPGR
jgi:hypothetical protein